MKLMIGLPCYAGKLDLDTHNSILGLARAVDFSVVGLRNESLITRGRNTLLAYFNHLREFTHLLFLDADVGISSRDIVRLLSHGKDCVGAAVRLKGNDLTGAPAYNVYPPRKYYEGEGDSDLQQVNRVGTAVFCLSRAACDALIKQAQRYRPNKLTQGPFTDIEWHYDVFRCGVVNEEYLSEDYWVCETLKTLGIPVWVDWSIRCKHWGNDFYA